MAVGDARVVVNTGAEDGAEQRPVVTANLVAGARQLVEHAVVRRDGAIGVERGVVTELVEETHHGFETRVAAQSDEPIPAGGGGFGGEGLKQPLETFGSEQLAAVADEPSASCA